MCRYGLWPALLRARLREDSACRYGLLGGRRGLGGRDLGFRRFFFWDFLRLS